jgi:hypothetical protein
MQMLSSSEEPSEEESTQAGESEKETSERETESEKGKVAEKDKVIEKGKVETETDESDTKESEPSEGESNDERATNGLRKSNSCSEERESEESSDVEVPSAKPKATNEKERTESSGSEERDDASETSESECEAPTKHAGTKPNTTNAKRTSAKPVRPTRGKSTNTLPKPRTKKEASTKEQKATKPGNKVGSNPSTPNDIFSQVRSVSMYGSSEEDGLEVPTNKENISENILLRTKSMETPYHPKELDTTKKRRCKELSAEIDVLLDEDPKQQFMQRAVLEVDQLLADDIIVPSPNAKPHKLSVSPANSKLAKPITTKMHAVRVSPPTTKAHTNARSSVASTLAKPRSSLASSAKVIPTSKIIQTSKTNIVSTATKITPKTNSTSKQIVAKPIPSKTTAAPKPRNSGK